MGCLNASFTRIGGNLASSFQRVGGNLRVSFSAVCGTDAGLGLLVTSDPSLLTENDDEFLSVNQNEE